VGRPTNATNMGRASGLRRKSVTLASIGRDCFWARTVHQPEEIGKQASTLIRRILLSSTREIDRLTDDLKDLRKKWENRSNRIQNDIVEYAELSQSAVQLTKIVSDSVAQVERRSGSDNPRGVVERLDSATVPMPATTKQR
jgi:hypothetical protein